MLILIFLTILLGYAMPNDYVRTYLCNRTSFDAVTKQHWLSVYRGKLKTRFLLKDSLTDAATVEDLIARAVDAMIAKLSKTK